MKITSASWLKVDPKTRPGFLLLTAGWILDLDDCRWVWVPRGLWCDGASVPNALWPLLRANPLRLIGMGVAHDYAVRSGAAIRGPSSMELRPFTLDEATELALAVAEYHGVGRFDRLKISAALNLSPRSYWRKRPVGWAPV